MNNQVIYDDGEIKWTVFGRDVSKEGNVIDTNEYAISTAEEIMLLDAGGTEIFPYVLSAFSEVMDLRKLKKFLCSHQDPDIFSSLPLWLTICPDAEVYLPWLWSDFVTHFGKECAKSFVKVPDRGQEIELGGHKLQLVPAHYLHASGNLNLFDPRSKILFFGGYWQCTCIS